MIFLLLSILSSTAIYALFKLFKNWGVNSFQAIVSNYFVASAFGFLIATNHGSIEIETAFPWLPFGMGVGVIFISMFYLMSKSSQVNGVSVTGLATKMSLLIPVAYFILFDPDEALTTRKGLGILLGIVALVLATSPKKDAENWKKDLSLPLIIFLGSGLLDLFLAFVEKHHLSADGHHEWFTPIPFGIAFIIGVIVLIIRKFTHGIGIDLKSSLAGIVLGLVNYGSIYFLLKVLGSGILDRSTVIPLNNVGVVTASALIGIFAFHERMTRLNLIGIVLSIVSIAILSQLW
jgi:drug/metabolite transporter (DMT)-like permease